MTIVETDILEYMFGDTISGDEIAPTPVKGKPNFLVVWFDEIDGVVDEEVEDPT